MTISINKVLIDATSAAIWNRSKIAVAMAIGVWAINIIFIIQGMFLLLPFTAGHMGSHNCCFFQQVLCAWVTNFKCFQSFPYLIHSCTLNGYFTWTRILITGPVL